MSARHGETDAHVLPYRECTDKTYAEHVLRTFGMYEQRRRVVMRGECPRCSHLMEFLAGDGPIPKSGQQPTPDGPTTIVKGTENTAPTLVMVCTCASQEHPGQPSGALGCGAYWEFEVSSGEDR